MPSERVPASNCLECGRRLTGLGSLPGEELGQLKEGDMALCVCIYCGAVMTLTPDKRLRGFTEEEMKDLVNDPAAMDGLARVVRDVHLYHQVRASRN